MLKSSNSGNISNLDFALEAISGKWKLQIINLLFDKPKRNNEILKQLNGISSKVLSQKLKELEDFNLIKKEIFAQVPPKVEYSLTKQTLKLRPIIMMLEQWGEELKESAI
jgi:DNA-binding HxlR family transcriptional regulator